mmetsp:Transcript_27622/g.65586  ORF Transcript_27622/g.65586 Transcript_27622/m.65586 type:complete len:222 (-) Transcript_27622:56-721(-)
MAINRANHLSLEEVVLSSISNRTSALASVRAPTIGTKIPHLEGKLHSLPAVARLDPAEFACVSNSEILCVAVILRAVVGVDHSIHSTRSAAKSELTMAFVASSTSKVTNVVIALVVVVRSTGHPLAKRCFRFHIAHSPQVLGAGATRKRKIQWVQRVGVVFVSDCAWGTNTVLLELTTDGDVIAVSQVVTAHLRPAGLSRCLQDHAHQSDGKKRRTAASHS